MTSLELYRLLRANEEVKDRRHPMFEKNKFMRILAIFMFLYYAAILLMVGTMLPFGLSGAYNGVAAFHVLDGYFPILLMVDFWVRFILQETPAQQAKPYALLPIRRSFLMNLYLVRAGLSVGNMFWFFMLIPFGLIAIVAHVGWLPFLGWLLGWWMLCVANGYAYLFARALCMRHFAWCPLPMAIHVGIVAIMFVPDSNPLDMPCTELLYAFARWRLEAILATAIAIASLYMANYFLQIKMVYNEVAGKEDVEMKKTTQMDFLNRYGKVGEYLKLELKLRFRNKQVRMQTLVVLGAMAVLSLMLDVTDIYDNGFMTSFICLYDYIVPGMTTLVTIMAYEGNYIDGLMARRESIYDLLKAKYYFNCSLLLIPMLLLIPSIVLGKISLMMNLGYLFLTAGVLYPCLFQMAVYNRDTLPLNQKITGKQANTVQNIISIVALFLPIGLEKLSVLCLGDTWGYVPLIVLGISGMATNRIWLGNIYARMMKRRHVNMEGFRSTRK